MLRKSHIDCNAYRRISGV